MNRILKNIFKNLILIVFFFCLNNTVNATILTKNDIEFEVYNQVSQDLKKYDVEDFELKILAIPVTSIKIPDGVYEIKTDKIIAKKLTSRFIVRTVLSVDGKYIRSFGVPIELKAYKTVMVAKNTIPRGDLITQEDIAWKKIDICNNLAILTTQDDLKKGMTSLKIFQPNEVINKRFIKIQPDIVKNSIVKIIFQKGKTISITTDGIALSDGKIGDYINIQNKQYKKIYTGKVIDNNKILVKI